MSTLGAELLRTASSIVLSTPALSMMLMVAILLPAVILTWVLMTAVFESQNRALSVSSETLALELRGLGGSVVLIFLNVPLSVLDTLDTLGSLAVDKAQSLLGILAVAMLMLGFLQIHQPVANTLLAWRCELNTVVETFVWQLANLARLLYAALWPLVNVGAEMSKFFTTDYYRLLLACSDPTDLYVVLGALADALSAFVTALGDFLGSGDLSTARIDFMTGLTALGTAANAALDPLNCFCAFLSPLWELVVALPQLASLQTALDALGNVPVRALQVLMVFLLMDLGELNTSNLATEINVAIISAGDFLEDALLLTLEAILGILSEIGALVASDAEAADLTPAFGTSTLAAAVHSANAPFWNQDPSLGLLNQTLGAQQLLQLLSSPWSHIFSEPLAGWVSLWNVTINAVSHPTCNGVLSNTCDCVFDQPTGQRFLQFGILGDRLRAALGAVASLSSVFDSNLVPVLAHFANFVAYMIQAVPELVRDLIYGIIWPPWRPEASPGYSGCDVCGSCDFSTPPAGWTALEVLVFTFNNTEASITRARDELLLDSDAVAALLGARSILLHIMQGKTPAGSFY